MSMKKTGKLIADLRKKQGMTQQELADKLGVTGKAISRWETGRGYPDVEMLPLLAKIFSVSVDELLSGELNDPDSKYVPSYAREGWRINSGEKHDEDKTANNEHTDWVDKYDRRQVRRGGTICGVIAGYVVLCEVSTLFTGFNVLAILLAVLMGVGMCYCGYSWIRFVYVFVFATSDISTVYQTLSKYYDVSALTETEQVLARLMIYGIPLIIVTIDVVFSTLLIRSQAVKDFLYDRRYL